MAEPGGHEGVELPKTSELQASREATQELRTAQEGWLERRGELEDTTHLTMSKREFDLLRKVGLGDGRDSIAYLIDKTREKYGIPLDAKYASIDIVPDDANQPHTTELVVVHESDFGTTVDEGRLDINGIKPEDMPHLTMSKREFDLLSVGLSGSTSSQIQYARDLWGIPWDDQYAPQYALIDIESDNPNLPNEPLLVIVNEEDFGTVIDREVIEKDNIYLKPVSDPDSPQTPESGGVYKTVDIEEDGTLDRSMQRLETFATELMKGRTTNPLSGGSYWMRAGDVATGQKDAYVWENSRPFASAVALTVAFPGQYDSVCAVVGNRQDAANGKSGMAQLKDPAVILKIEGEHLKRLQEIYRDLYRVPDFALNEAQRLARDEQFNFQTFGLIYEAVSTNQAREYDDSTVLQPKLRARETPRS